MRTGVLAGFDVECRRRGIDPYALAQNVGLPREVLTHADLYVRRELTAALLEAAANECDDDGFTMDLVDTQKLTAIGAIAYLPFQGATVREGIELVDACLGYHIQGVAHRVRDLSDGRSVVGTEFGLPAEPRFRQAAEMSFWRVEIFLRALLGPAHAPVEYWSTYPEPHDPSRYESRFDAPILWNQPRAGHVVRTSSLDLPPHRQPNMKTFLMEVVQKATTKPENETVAAEVRTVVRSLIGQSRPTLETVAAAMGTYARDLQRQLSESEASFSDIRDHVHLEYARKSLANRDTSITVLALELGYSESSAFSRAFKNWTGATPSAWRRQAK